MSVPFEAEEANPHVSELRDGFCMQGYCYHRTEPSPLGRSPQKVVRREFPSILASKQLKKQE